MTMRIINQSPQSRPRSRDRLRGRGNVFSDQTTIRRVIRARYCGPRAPGQIFTDRIYLPPYPGIFRQEGKINAHEA